MGRGHSTPLGSVDERVWNYSYPFVIDVVFAFMFVKCESTLTVADPVFPLEGRLYHGTPPEVQIILDFMQCFGNFGKIIVEDRCPPSHFPRDTLISSCLKTFFCQNV